jgi:transcriptional regulator of arginine metabolism
MTMDKTARQYAIKEVITSSEVSSQDDLRHALKKRGFSVTQSTLSRDMRELGVSWVTAGERGRYIFQPATAEVEILRPFVGSQVLSIDANESVIVVRTLPACANVVGEFIDAQLHGDIIGTIAGDNALLVIPRSQKKTKQVVEFLKTKLIKGRQ